MGAHLESSVYKCVESVLSAYRQSILFLRRLHHIFSFFSVVTDILVELLPMVIAKVWHHLKSGPAALFILHKMENVVLIRFF